jgi:hypothetical protein
MHLGSVSHDEVAVGETGERVQLVDEELPEAFALVRVLGRVDDAKR